MKSRDPEEERAFEDEPSSRRRRSEHEDEDEAGDAGRADRGPVDTEAAGPVDEPLSRTLHDDLHDFLFSGFKSALELRIQATTMLALLESVDPQTVSEELTRRSEQLPRQVLKVFRRHTDWDPKIDEEGLAKETKRRIPSLQEHWDALDDALRAMQKGLTIPEEDGQAYLAAVRSALGPEGQARKISYPRALGLLSMVGPALESPFRPGKAGSTQPKRLLGSYHAVLRAGLEAVDEAWQGIWNSIVASVARGGGPRLQNAAGIWGKSQELSRLKEKAQVLLTEGEPRKALKVVEMARAQDPRDGQLVVLGLRIALTGRQKEDADRYLLALEKDFPDLIEGIVLRVELLQSKNEPRSLIALAEKGLTIDPRHRELREMLAKAHAKANDHQKTLKIVNSLTQDYPNEAEYWHLKARAHGFLDQQQGALDALKKYASLQNLDSEKLNRIKADEAFDCLAASTEFEKLLQANLDILALADSIFTSDQKTFFFPDEIPTRKLQNAQSKWLKLNEDEQIVFLIDTTFLGRCTEGIAVTNERILWKDMGCDPEEIPLAKVRLDKLKVSDGKVIFGRQSLNLVGQPNLISPMFQFLQALARSNS